MRAPVELDFGQWHMAVSAALGISENSRSDRKQHLKWRQTDYTRSGCVVASYKLKYKYMHMKCFAPRAIPLVYPKLKDSKCPCVERHDIQCTHTQLLSHCIKAITHAAASHREICRLWFPFVVLYFELWHNPRSLAFITKHLCPVNRLASIFSFFFPPPLLCFLLLHCIAFHVPGAQCT